MMRAFCFFAAAAAFAASPPAMATATAVARVRVHGGQGSLSPDKSQSDVLVLADLSSSPSSCAKLSPAGGQSGGVQRGDRAAACAGNGD